MNIVFFVYIFVIIKTMEPVNSRSVNQYLHERRSFQFRNIEEPRILKSDDQSEVKLNSKEKIVNEYLMKLKAADYDIISRGIGFTAPFKAMKEQVEQSQVFSFLKRMPKGSVLHGHSSVLGSPHWIVKELSYWPDLYQLKTMDDGVRYKFMNKPENSDWKLVSDLRKDVNSEEEFDQEILHHITLLTTDPYDVPVDADTAWIQFERSITALSGLMGYKESFKHYFEHILEHMVKDGVSYLEIRCSSFNLYDKDGSVLDPEYMVEVAQDISTKFVEKNPDKFHGVRFIYAPHKRISDEEMQEKVALIKQLVNKYPDSIIGFDLVGQETKGKPFKSFLKPLIDLSNDKIDFYFHAGESAIDDNVSTDNLIEAVLLGSKRIGHGFSLPKYKNLVSEVRHRDIAVEICAISNQMLKMLPDLATHPARLLHWMDVPLVISSDSPLTWDTDPLSHDFYVAFMAYGEPYFDLVFLKKLAMDSIQHAGLHILRKTKLMIIWTRLWDEFIEDMIRTIKRESTQVYKQEL